MKNFIETYERIRSDYPSNTLLAFLTKKSCIFFKADAQQVSQVLGEEAQQFEVSQFDGADSDALEIPNNAAPKIFEALIEAGYTLAMIEEVPLEKIKETPKKASPEEQAMPASSVCSICGKPLTLPSSIQQGMGNICANHSKILGNVSPQEHRKSLVLESLTDEWIPLKEYLAAGKAIGITPCRLMNAAGGDRALRKPLHPSFQIRYFGNRRYVHRSALEHLEEARLKHE
ncbi:MAG TPA: DUF6011 domain-containing protein [Paludibacteraceae bacterium]|nr:DUF6011 domain-containing protein [Paludibacteraceae bacterium]